MNQEYINVFEARISELEISVRELKGLVNNRELHICNIRQHDQLLTVNDVVKLLGLPRHIIYSKAMSGEIPSLRIGKRYRFSRRKVLGWFEGNFDKTIEVDEFVDKYLKRNILSG